ncbi:MAG: DUF4290 domain-containing protein [Paludibacteraceae bacterium]|nr:DUF4290 domain-containing protein [Paludibacteraceae bacterium]
MDNLPKNKLILTEYGRNIQKMVEYAMTIEDKEERTKCVNTIIDTMGIFFPHLRDVNDFKHKLWDHLAIMSNYKLDIDYPYDVPQEPQKTVPDKIPYPNGNVRYRYYGEFMNKLVGLADKLEGNDRERYIEVIANHMKRCYLVWNKDNVEDKTILQDLFDMSNGKIDLRGGEFQLKSTEEMLQRQNPAHQQNNKKNSKKTTNKKK